MSCAAYPLICSYTALFAAPLLLSVLLGALACYVAARRGHRANRLPAAVSAAAFAMLGFVVGLLMAQSREPSVDVVLPAVLTLLGGLLVYLIGAKGITHQLGTAAMVLCFVFSLLVGSQYGARLRFDHEMALADPAYLAGRELYAVEIKNKIAIMNLLSQTELLGLVRDIAEQKGLDPALLRAAFMTGKPETASDSGPKKP